jgi:hypothetical protein
LSRGDEAGSDDPLGTARSFLVYLGTTPMGRPTVMLALTAAIVGCNSDEGGGGRERPEFGERISVLRAGKGCPGTRPSRRRPFPGQDFNYGNRYLGAALWRRGRLVAARDGSRWGQIMPDGSIWANVGWWRAVPGRLTIRGERLDAAAPPLRAKVPAGYGSTGFQSTGLIFPTPGCWRVVGTVAGHELGFVVFVTKRVS